MIRVAADDHFMPREELEGRLKDVEKDVQWIKRLGGVGVALAIALGTGILATLVTALVQNWPEGS